MRLFVALEIPAPLREHFAQLVKILHVSAPHTKWVRPQNLHVTMKFIGEAGAAKLPAICSALSTVRSEQPIELHFRGLGFFPSEQFPRVLWAGMAASQNMRLLAADMDDALEKAGFPREPKPFTPHLTLARFQPPGMPAKLHAAFQEYASRDFGALHTREFQLIESKLKPTGAEYTTLQSFSFAAEA